MVRIKKKEFVETKIDSIPRLGGAPCHLNVARIAERAVEDNRFSLFRKKLERNDDSNFHVRSR